MSVHESDISPKGVVPLLEALTAALVKRGLVAESFGARMVLAKNTAADPSKHDPLAVALSPGLRQMMICQPDGAGRLAWFWVWSGPTRKAPSEFEYLCPAEEIDRAADRISRVLSLDGIDPEPAR
ncbi:hypothetical protein [Actinomadura xylanilytica]|uniref:hypothetical protein n=1 Tax=Actinomadura xylanilytica TaxID=887459 RepID=UPI00255B3649|nr:hypothetical protein [Actinomadura xylanilytica]MDL4777589.1 hypothetical protein [Actinomadura xylanilytica]